MSEIVDVSLTQPSVAAVVVTRNRRDHLRQCLETLRHQTNRPRYVIVVDNESEDQTAEMVGTEFPDAIFHRLSENRGSGGGYAEALRLGFETGALWLWAIDDEVRLDPDVLERMLNKATEQGGVDVVLPAEVDPRTGRRRVHPAWYGPLIHRDVIERVGLPRADFFWYAADTEFFRRVARGGFRIVKAGDILILHDKRNPERFVRKRDPGRLYYQTRNTFFIRRQTFAKRYYYRLPFHVARLVFGRMARVVFSREPDKLRKCMMIGRGAFDGLRGKLGKTVEIG